MVLNEVKQYVCVEIKNCGDDNLVKVITYGTYDLFHKGHYNLLKKAKELGDYLIVAVTSDGFDKARGKLNVHDSVITRVKNVEKTGLADEIIIEEYFGQKIDDIKKYNIDIFTVGSDWIGHFDYLNEYCKVIYLDRTKGISSTELRNKNLINLGIVGSEDIIHRFNTEVKYVSGINITGIYNEDTEIAYKISKNENIKLYNALDKLYIENDAVYIACPPKYHYKYIKDALINGKHVLCEFPFCLNLKDAKELFEIAESKNLVLMEALKTAYCPAFTKIVPMIKSGVIGNIISVDACFTQIQGEMLEKQIQRASGGSINSLASYPLLAIFKFLGTDYKAVSFTSKLNEKQIDIYTKFDVLFDKAIGSGIVAINAKNEGSLTVTGTKGYLYVPAPWWKTNYFEIRQENIMNNSKYFYKFEGEGMRYEILDFAECIKNNRQSILLTKEEILAMSSVFDKFSNDINIVKI